MKVLLEFLFTLDPVVVFGFGFFMLYSGYRISKREKK